MTRPAIKIFLPLRLALFMLPLMAVLQGCYTDNEEDLYPVAAGGCNTSSVTYSGTVKAIVAQSCAYAGCHAGSPAASGINLEAHAGLQAIATSGQLLGVINHASGYSPMPKNGPKLPQCSIDQIAQWVGAGAPDN